MPEKGRSTYIPGWKPSRAYSYDSEARKRPTYTPNYTPKTATPIRTVTNPGGGSLNAQEADYTPSDMKRYSADSSNKAIASLNAGQAPTMPTITPSTPGGSLNARGSGQNYGGGSRSRSSGSSSKALDYASQLNQGLASSFSPVPEVGGYTMPGSRPYDSPDRWSDQQARTQIFPTAITKGQQASNLMAAQGTPSPVAVGLGFAQDVAEGVVGGKLLPNLFRPNVSQVSQLTPTMSLGRGSLTTRVADAAKQNLSNLTPQLIKSVSQSSVAPLAGAAVGSSLLPTTSAPGPSSVTGGPSGVNQPTIVDNTTQNSVATQGGGNIMGVPTGGQGVSGGGQNNMGQAGQNNMAQDAFLQGMYNANRPGFLGQGNQMEPTNTPTQNVAQPEQPPPGMFNPTQYRQEVEQLFSGINQQNAALMLKLSEQLVGQLDTLEADLRKQYEQQGSVLDPATQAALKEMRSEVDRRRQGLQEEMNRRGLLQSGIWLQEENRILGNQLTAEEKLLAGRVADIQNRMTDALRQLGTQRINTMGTLAQNQMQNQQWTQGQQINAMNTLNTRNDQWNQWWQGQLANQKAEAEKTRQFGVTSAETARHNQATEANQMNKGSYSDSATSRYMQQIPTYPSLEEALADFQRFRSVMEGEKADTQRILNTIYAHFGVQ